MPDYVPDITDEAASRSVILFSLILARRMIRRKTRWDVVTTIGVLDKLDELIEEYQDPYGHSQAESKTCMQAPIRQPF